MSKIFTADEVKKHNSRRNLWIVIRNDVYDVSSFLAEHPGGEDPLLEAAGQDATIAFDDVGHSADARAMLSKYKVGSLAKGQGCCKMKPRIWRSSTRSHASASEAASLNECPSFASDERPWRSYHASRSPSRKSPRSKSPPSPNIGRRVPSIVVPRERNSSKLKWALIALGLAIIIGIAYKRYAS